MGAQGGQRLGQGVNVDGAQAAQARAHAQLDDRVGQQRDAEHVVEVAVRDQDVVDAGEFVQAQLAHAAARVDEDVVIEQEGRGVAARRDRAEATEDADHGDGPPG